MLANWVIAGMLLGALWSVLCRLKAMRPSKTSACAALQHMVLGLGIIGALVLPAQAANTALVMGLSVYLAIGAHRWRFGAPGDLGRIKQDDVSGPK